MNIRKKSFYVFILLSACAGAAAFTGCSSDTGGGPGGPTWIDLVKDLDGDGVPDELEDVVASIEALAAGGTPGTVDDNETDAVMGAITDLVKRLPFSEEALAIQAGIASLTEKLVSEQDEAEMKRLTEELADKQALLLTDPTYAALSDGLSKIVERRMDEQTNAVLKGEMAAGTAVGTAAGPNYSKMRRGDILLEYNNGISRIFPYVWQYTHAGIYDGDGMVYESVSKGVALNPLTGWQTSGTRISLFRSKDRCLNRCHAISVKT
ncbi:MAG: hypothetical protein WC889_10765 [Myxococcota bacterium]|jgi:hypothetical protein